MPDITAEIDIADAIKIWWNRTVPVVFKPEEDDIVVRVPLPDRGQWLSIRDWLLGTGRKIDWVQKWEAWRLPRGRFSEIVLRVLARNGSVYVIQIFRPLSKCAPACWNAEGPDCDCSCLGANHGSGQELEHIVSETYAFERGERKLSCRLLKKKAV